jgi:NADH dehydrogenase/NADH:ubiquinone oxidoreductase subunit G
MYYDTNHESPTYKETLMDTPIVDAPITINERKDKIYKLGQELDREAKRLAHSGERELSCKWIDLNDELKQAKEAYEKIVGRPYSPPNPTLFSSPRTRTSSAESQHQEEETASAKLS